MTHGLLLFVLDYQWLLMDSGGNDDGYDDADGGARRPPTGGRPPVLASARTHLMSLTKA